MGARERRSSEHLLVAAQELIFVRKNMWRSHRPHQSQPFNPLHPPHRTVHIYYQPLPSLSPTFPSAVAVPEKRKGTLDSSIALTKEPPNKPYLIQCQFMGPTKLGFLFMGPALSSGPRAVRACLFRRSLNPSPACNFVGGEVNKNTFFLFIY